MLCCAELRCAVPRCSILASTSVRWRLNIDLSSSEFVENNQRFLRSSMVMTRTSGFKNATV
eukprot:13451930-Heterocapsa_arctica.AAC.1